MVEQKSRLNNALTVSQHTDCADIGVDELNSVNSIRKFFFTRFMNMCARSAGKVAFLQILLSVVLTLTLVTATPQAMGGDTIATIEVESGDVQRVDHPVSVTLPEGINSHHALRLAEVGDGEVHPIPHQVEPARDGVQARLWFILDGTTPENETRRFELNYGLPVQGDAVEVAFDDQSVMMGLEGQTIFHYNHQHVLPPRGVDPQFVRSGYIHPVYSPSGMLVTEDFPGRHAHHKGVWFPWVRTEFEGRRIDFWNLADGTGTVQFAGFDTVTSGPVFGHLIARHEHMDLTQGHGKAALNETWDVRAYNAGGLEDGWWKWDLTATQECATDSPLELLEYHYGGLGFRGAAEWTGDNYKILTSEGHTKSDGHTKRARWAAHSGEIEDGRAATVVIMVHPDNDRFPEPMRVWERGGAFFCFSPMQLGSWTMEPDKQYQFRYRFLVHEGGIDAEHAERAWQEFAEPADFRLELD